MNRVKLGDIATYINGYAFKPSDWSTQGIPIIRIQNLTGNNNLINYYEGNYLPKYEINDGDVLISWSASLGVFIWHNTKAVLNQHIFKVVFDKIDVDKNFFVYQVEFLLKRAENAMHGATMKHLTRPVFESMSFYLPTLDEQKIIAKKLFSIDNLIHLRKIQMKKLDELVKSRFVEFLKENKNSIEYKQLKDICSLITDGTHQSPKFQMKGIPFLFVSNINTNEINYESNKFIDCDTYEKLIQRTPIELGDILLSIVGSYGHPAIVKSTKKFCFQRHIAYLKPKSNIINSTYLHTAILSDYVQKQISDKVKGIAQKTLNLSELKTITIPLISIEDQAKIYELVLKADKSKVEVQKSLDKLETLKKSLMQEYFS